MASAAAEASLAEDEALAAVAEASLVEEETLAVEAVGSSAVAVGSLAAEASSEAEDSALATSTIHGFTGPHITAVTTGMILTTIHTTHTRMIRTTQGLRSAWS